MIDVGTILAMLSGLQSSGGTGKNKLSTDALGTKGKPMSGLFGLLGTQRQLGQQGGGQGEDDEQGSTYQLDSADRRAQASQLFAARRQRRPPVFNAFDLYAGL